MLSPRRGNAGVASHAGAGASLLACCDFFSSRFIAGGGRTLLIAACDFPAVALPYVLRLDPCGFSKNDEAARRRLCMVLATYWAMRIPVRPWAVTRRQRP